MRCWTHSSSISNSDRIAKMMDCSRNSGQILALVSSSSSSS